MTALELTPKYAYQYAREVIKGRFEEGESIIATCAYTSYLYAREVIKGRFETGEAAIATHANVACFYAIDIIKDRWPIGEVEIMKYDMSRRRYTSTILNDYRWIEAEIKLLESTHFELY